MRRKRPNEGPYAIQTKRIGEVQFTFGMYEYDDGTGDARGHLLLRRPSNGRESCVVIVGSPTTDNFDIEEMFRLALKWLKENA